MASIELKNVHKQWGQFIAVDDFFNLTISDNEFLVSVFPSGCGKTTTMRMIAGLKDVSSGDIFIDGRWVNELERAKTGCCHGIPVLRSLSEYECL